jgi:Viral BACON domain
MEQIKKILYLSGLIIFAVSIISCNDDFLSNNNKKFYILTDTLFVNNTQQNVLTAVQIPDLKNSDYSIFIQPKWVSFNSMHGKVTDGILGLSFSIVKNDSTSAYQTHYGQVIIDIDDFGLLSLIIAYSNFGYPTLHCSTSSLNFESSSPQTFTISNISDGVLKWEITEIPDWLALSATSGSLYTDNSSTITASLNTDNISAGQELSGTLKINSNSTTGSIYTISVHVSAKAIIPNEVRQINGIVTDAEFNHESGIMAICTKSPNSLIIFNTLTNESSIISLNKAPDCVSISEDGHKALIGYTVSSVSYFNIDSLRITKDFNIDCVPYDIVLGDSGWCYITPLENQWVYFRSLNLNSGELIVGTNWSTVYEKTIIRKIHGKPYLVGTRTAVTPSGILIFDITKGKASDIISYYHESTGNILISEDGSRLYASCRNVYYLPAYDTQYHTSAPPVFGQISSEYNNIPVLEECPAINSVFTTSSYYSYMSGNSSLIEQFNTTNLNKTGSFNVAPVSLTVNGIKVRYETSPWYLFANKEGSRLYAIKNLKADYNKDFWTIEVFQLNK